MLSTLKQSSKFDYNLPALWLKPFKCSVCGQEYALRAKPVRRPLLMKCFHTVCEMCCTGPRPIHLTCRQCNEVSRIDKNQRTRETFPLAYFLMGLVNYIEFNLAFDVSIIDSSGSNEKRDVRDKYNLQECNECSDVLTNHVCVQCKAAFCPPCFERVHQQSKVFQRHHLTQLDRRGKPSIVLDQDKRCRFHNNFVNKYCCDCQQAMCVLCVMQTHGRHKVTNLGDENQKSLAQIASLLESVKGAKEANKIAQKDAKYIAKRYEDYATESIHEISQYFLYLHGVLQSIEREVQVKVRNGVIKVLNQVRKVQTDLKTGHETLDEIIHILDETISKPPMHGTVSNVLKKANNLLETTPCKVQFEGVNSNPFEFVKLRKPPLILPSLCEVNINTAEFNSTLLNYLGERGGDDSSSLAEGLNDELLKSVATKPVNESKVPSKPVPMTPAIAGGSGGGNKKNKRKNAKNKIRANTTIQSQATPVSSQNINPSNASTSLLSTKNSTTLEATTTLEKVYVTHIQNPENIFVQFEQFMTRKADFENLIRQDLDIASTPSYIEKGEMYLVLNGATQQWYRGRVVELGDMNKVFLVDHGLLINVAKQRFRTLTETLKNLPTGASKCALYGVRPASNEWDDRACDLMWDIIKKGQLVSMVIYKNDTVCEVDLITTHLTYPTSVRNALIFAELAVDDTNITVEMKKRVKQLSGVRKSLLTPPTEKLYRNVFKEGESFRAHILKVTDPTDFYAIKHDHSGAIERLCTDLNKDYKGQQEKLFTPLANTPCAVGINENWFRGRIVKVESKSHVDVYLVDKAETETVSYTQLRILLPQYLQINEYAFHCSLTDIQPLQKFGYIWTPSSISEFVRILQNSVLQIIVQRTENFRHHVVLYKIKKTIDVNVNALLVKYGHARSIGNDSQFVEHPKINELDKPDEDLQNNINIMEMTLNETQRGAATGRTKVKLSNIITPGEFYLRLNQHQVGINKLHEEIQILMKDKNETSPSSRDTTQETNDKEKSENDSVESKWEAGNFCLVRLKLKPDASLQWYRGQIKDIGSPDNAKYSVFLRDHGLTFSDILSRNIAPIPSHLSRVCDGTIKCRLACIQPTGGLETWSASASDEFKSVVDRFTELAATVQGPPTKGAMSIVLWGLKQECPDPLAPAINKWVNINRYLCNSGLAHLIEKFTPITEENVLSPILLDGEETFDHWLKQLIKTVDQPLKEETPTSILKHGDDSDAFDEEEEAYLDEDGEEFTTWKPPKEITKTVFVGIPTFVDDEGVIYLYDAAQKKVFDNISVVVNKVVQKMKPSSSEETFWYTGQPCLAQFNIDGKFYRAVVLETKPDRRVNVQFVDFGNTQECSIKDLRKQITLSQIPIQVNIYRLEGILPPEGCKKYSNVAMDFLYAHIISKPCSIRVSTEKPLDGIKLCTIKCGSINMAELMIEAGYARKPQVAAGLKFLSAIVTSRENSPIKNTKNNANRSENATLIPFEKTQNQPEIDHDKEPVNAEKTKDPPRSDDEESYAPKLDREYEEMFDKMFLDNLKFSAKNSDKDSDDDLLDEGKSTYAPIHCSVNLTGAIDIKSDESKNQQKPIYNGSDDEGQELLEPQPPDTASSSFDPPSTSSKLPNKVVGPENPFPSLKLPANSKGFWGEVSFILDVTTVAIFPNLRDHIKIMDEVSKEIQTAASLSSNIKNVNYTGACLAMYSEDKMWYRGLVRAYCSEDNKFDVVFVDFLNAEWVPARKVRLCPPDILEIPLRNLVVRLAGVRPNHRWRSVDVKERFSRLVQDRQIFIRIVKNTGTIPVVELYEDDDTDELLYQPMLADRFYLKQ